MHSIVPDGIFHHTPRRALQPSASVTSRFRRMRKKPLQNSHHLQISDDGFMPCSIIITIDSAITQNTDATLNMTSGWIRLVISIENGPTRFNNFLTSHSLVNLDQPVLTVPSISSYLTSSALWRIEKCDLDQILGPKSTSPTDATSGEHHCTQHTIGDVFSWCAKYFL